MNVFKVFLPILLALVIAFGSSLMLYRWIQGQTAPKEVVAVQKDTNATPVVVSASDLKWGTVLKQEMMKTVPFLQESLPPDYFAKPEDLIGRVLVSQLKPNEPITESRLAPEDVKVGGVSAVLGKGKRAVSVKGDKVSGISGFIQPGNKVDVLVTMKHPDSGKDITKLVMDDIKVLATGSKIENSKNGEQAPVDVYTLEVSPEEAEKISLASNRGRLQFALRNIKDTDKVTTSGAYISETLNSLMPMRPEEKDKPAKTGSTVRQRSRHVVEVINGQSRTQKKF